VRSIVLVLLASIALSASPRVQPSPRDGQTPASQLSAILESGRAALGGSTALGAVRELELETEVSRRSGVTASISYEFALPDRFLQIGSMDLIPNRRVYRGINAGQLIARTEGSSGATPTAEQRPPMIAILQKQATRLLVGLLLTESTPIPVQYSYVGRAEAPDGSAETLRVTGPDGFDIRIFLDAQSHLPLMLSHMVPTPGKIQQERDGDRMSTRVTRDPQAPATVEERWLFSGHVNENGVLLPSLLTVSVAGETTEQWTIRRRRINPGFPKDRFATR
jgi:hypothetical protein